MKLAGLLTVTTWCSIIVARSETADVETNQEALLQRAADQLNRLTPFRKIAEETNAETNLENLLEIWKPVADQNHLDERKDDSADQGVPWEMLEVLAERGADATKRIDDEGMIAIGVITDPQYAAMMQDRIKRGFTPGSAGLLTSIAGGVLSGVASASSSSAGKASASSSEYKPIYGVPSTPVEHSYSYGEKHFGPWEFKKAIFSTFVQALKAIGGGVLALKGQLVKGSSYLLAAKSKVFDKTGDAITSLGKKLAASAITESKPSDTYYDHPPIQNIEHDPSYHGPPPNYNDYTEYIPHESYAMPSEDNDQGGLLIVTPTKSDLDEHDDQHVVDVAAVPEKPDLATLEESFGGPTKGTVITNLLSSVPKGSAFGTKDQLPTVNQDQNNNVDSYSAIQHPAPTVGALDHYPASHGNPLENYEQNYHAGQDVYQLPPQTALPHHLHDHQHQYHYHHHLGKPDDPNLTIQPSVEYPPLHLQQIQYPQGIDLLNSPPKLPHDDDGMSVYSSLSIDTESHNTPSLPHSGVLDLPKLQSHVDFHGVQSHFANHGSLGGPLKISLLNSKPSPYYWQMQGSAVPMPMPILNTFDQFNHFHKRNASPRRRMFAKRYARYSSLQRHHRPL